MTQKLPRRCLVFSDLDGTLLDRADYSWGAARSALERLARDGVPLIFVTSKTRVEVEALNQELANPAPFVFENGSGIALPVGFDETTLPTELSEHVETRGCVRVIALGKNYAELRRFLKTRAERYGLRGFGDLRTRELADWTGLTSEAARNAQQREFSEPFRCSSEIALGEFRDEASTAGYEVVRGGRFFHLQGGATKGYAVRELIRSYSALWGRRPRTLALGDAENDLPMLAEVDRAVWFGPRQPSELTALGTALHCPSDEGPAAWSRQVLGFLAEPTPEGAHV